jgi:hypothetical protein
MKTYQNLTDRELSIPDIGLIAPHGTVQTELTIENQNFKLITNDDKPLPHLNEEVVVPAAPEVEPAPAAPEQAIEGEI